MKVENHTDSATVLTSWKDIARYMGKGVRTVQRWEQDFGLPVRRPHGSNKKAVLARPRDLDLWVAMRCSSRAQVAIKAGLQNVGDSKGNGDGPPSYHLSLGALCSLNAQIEASKMLQDNNRVLIREVSAQLDALRSHIMTLSNSR
ncbi:MAG TPA: hypothetical protein VHZ25_05880 [Acidobacteriaceae bacterium]|nr:hypothetical protein [Acidobacteriaceae bacterium]